MSQNKIKINNVVIPQPDTELNWDFETTYSEDSTRVRGGRINFTALFTVEALGYKRTGMTSAELSTLLRMIVGKKFSLFYFSPYYAAWRTDTFYVGKGSLRIGELDDTSGRYDSVEFNMIGVNPI